MQREAHAPEVDQVCTILIRFQRCRVDQQVQLRRFGRPIGCGECAAARGGDLDCRLVLSLLLRLEAQPELVWTSFPAAENVLEHVGLSRLPGRRSMRCCMFRWPLNRAERKLSSALARRMNSRAFPRASALTGLVSDIGRGAKHDRPRPPRPADARDRRCGTVAPASWSGAMRAGTRPTPACRSWCTRAGET